VANAIMPMALTGIGGGRPAFAPEQHRETVRALKPLLSHMTVDNVAPLVTYLASRRCTVNRGIFSVGCGHVARIVVAVSRGWYAPGLDGMTPEDVEASLDAACDLEEIAVPESMNGETRFIAEHLP
jgi:hypothetical protein